MSELADFSNKIDVCDMIVLTPVGIDRLYCRFFLDGLYQDRIFVTDPFLMAELTLLMSEGEVIDAAGVASLKKKVGANLT